MNEKILKEDDFTLSSLLYIYKMNGKHASGAGVFYELDEPVDFQIMEKAYLKAIRRFPYYMVKMGTNDEKIYRIWVDEPNPLRQDPVDYLINEKDNDGYLYRLSVNGNTVSFQFFHGISDGISLNNFMKLLFKLYFEEKGEEVSMVTRFDIGQEVSEREYCDPLDEPAVCEVTPGSHERGTFYLLPEENNRDFRIFYFDCDAAKLMDIVRTSDGSPNTYMAILLAESIAEVHPERDIEKIRVGITIDGKHFIGLSENHNPMLGISCFDYDKRAFSMDRTRLNTCVRGRLILDCDDVNIIPQIASPRKYLDYLKMMPTLAEKRGLSARTYIPVSTASISYVGKCDMGSIEKHLNHVYTFSYGDMPLLEINAVNGKFCFTFSSRADNICYMEKIREKIMEIGVECTELKTMEFKEDRS
ncbi:MAG: hypothetical protein Q4B67_00945 [Eubacteriales bacterium]|nr:hypothetical protein [Eubacteriales bacterium]